jgi:hypothetical protein
MSLSYWKQVLGLILTKTTRVYFYQFENYKYRQIECQLVLQAVKGGRLRCFTLQCHALDVRSF